MMLLVVQVYSPVGIALAVEAQENAGFEAVICYALDFADEDRADKNQNTNECVMCFVLDQNLCYPAGDPCRLLEPVEQTYKADKLPAKNPAIIQEHKSQNVRAPPFYGQV
ncbi:MAG: hypothetical protein HWE30_13065 [Methylocystaceae bacterium]|nr:hypothetical protein [Methylocystaceae bacterium]